jgi:hypothetical protein
LKAKDFILPRNEERVVLELPLWNRKHRFLQKNNVATVSEEAAVKIKNTHSTQGERNRKKQKKESEIQISSALFQLFFSSPCQIAPRSNTTCFVNCPKQFAMIHAKYNPT